MSGIANWQAQIRIDIEDLKKRIKVAEGEINNFTNEDRKVKLDIDTKTLESAIQKLDKMLDSLGKGTGDFKQFENLSKELSSIVSEVQSLSKAFGKVDDSGAKTLLSSIQNIDKSLSELSQNILNVNKNMSNMGSNTSGAVKQVENITNESKKAASALEDVAKAQEKINGQKSNISSGMKDAFQVEGVENKLGEVAQSEQKVKQEAKETNDVVANMTFKPNTESFDDIIAKFGILKENAQEIISIVKSTRQTTDGFAVSYDAKLKNGTKLTLGENSNSQILNAKETVYSNTDFEKAKVEDLKSTYKELTTAISEYKDVASRISSNKALDGDEEKMDELLVKIEQLQNTPILQNTKELDNANAKLERIENNLDVIQEKAKQTTISGFDKRLESYNKKTSGYNATIARFNDGGWTSSTYLENVQAVKNAVHEYETLLNELKGKDASLVTSEDISNLDNYEKKIKDTIATVTNMSAAEKGYSQLAGQKEIDKINKILRENSAMSSEAKAKIKAYKQELISGNPSVSLEKIHGEIMKIVNAEELAGRAGRSMFDVIKEKAFYGFAAQIGMYFGFNDIVNLGKEGFNVVRELNTAFTEMRKVSDESLQSLKNYQATTFDTADAVGTTAKQIQNSTADWMRLGESMNQAAESAKDANVLLNVSEFEGIDEATESLVSMSQAYKDLDKMDIIDVLNNIGNNYSISTDGLATALKDSASALVTANNDLNEAVSLTTAGNAITQDPSKVGAGLRTISLRLVGTEEAKQELSNLGEETDGMITTVSKLRDTIMDATKAASSDGKGFDILDSNGNYKSTYEIMQGLADLYDNIVKKDKELGTNNLNLLLETIAGKNRSNIAASILQNGDMLRSVYEDAQNSEGSAEKELNSYLDSIDGKMAQLENRAQEFWFKVIDSETIKNGIDLLSTLLKGTTDFVDTVGLLPTILTGIGAALSFKNVGRDKMYSLSF